MTGPRPASGSGSRVGPGRTGARRPAAAAEAPPAARGRTTTYRGIRWRKDPDGTIGWYNADAGGWMRWSPGGDAPPVPPAWQEDAAAVPLPPRVQRASWRSPYRLVPVALVVAAVVIGVWQATSGSPAQAAANAHRQAEALVGRCLPRASAGGQEYSTTAVACSSSSAAVRVVALVPDGARCPGGAGLVRLAYAGVVIPDAECVTPVHRG